MNLLNFVTNFLSEESCKWKWKKIRDREGVICSKGRSIEHYWKSDKDSYECKNCGYRQSLRANMVMHGSWLSLRYWFIFIHLITSMKKCFFSKEFQHQVGHKYYEPIWATIGNEVVNNVEKHSIIDTDGSSSYKNFGKLIVEHLLEIIFKELINKSLQCIHLAISNVKRMFLDIFHDINPDYLQNYLNEFCYKFNWRYFRESQFERVFVASVSHKNQFRYIYNKH